MKRASIGAAIFLVLFGLPFLGMGLAFAMQSASRSGRDALFGTIFGLFFAVIGAGLMVVAVVGYSKTKQDDTRAAANPDKPWLWREDWAAGKANGDDPRANITVWVFTAFWDIMSAFVTLKVLPDLLKQADPRALLVLIFPLAGLVITAFAVRGTLRVQRYGKTSFQFDRAPFIPGGRVKGTIRLKLPTATPHGIDLRLSCKRRIVTGSGKNQSVNELVLWQEQANVPAQSVMQGLTGAEIPVEFAIPQDACGTDNSNPRDRVYWQLQAKADVPGADFSDHYELPVFRTGAEVSTEVDSTVTPRSEQPAQAPEKTKIIYSDDGSGPSFYFPPMRNPMQALGVLGFAAVWSVVVYLLWTRSDAPWLFRIVFSLFELLVVYMVLSTFFGSALIRVREGTLQVRTALLGMGSLRRLPFDEVSSLSLLSQGRPNAAGELMYGIAVDTGGRSIKVAASSLTQAEARWIVATLERAMGRKQDTSVEFDSIYGAPPQSGMGAGKS